MTVAKGERHSRVPPIVVSILQEPRELHTRELVERNSFGYVIPRESSRHVGHNFKPRVAACFANDDGVSFPCPELQRSAMSKLVGENEGKKNNRTGIPSPLRKQI